MADKHEEERQYPEVGLKGIEKITRPPGQIIPSTIKASAIGMPDTFPNIRIPHNKEEEG